MTPIIYLVGDATDPIVAHVGGRRLILHICNDAGAWGAGFVLALSRRWMKPEAHYRAQIGYSLGEFDFVEVSYNLHVVNIIGQDGVGGDCPIRYWAVAHAFEEIARLMVGGPKSEPLSIHCPRLGCGLAGGDWSVMSGLLQNSFGRRNVPVFVYDLPGG